MFLIQIREEVRLLRHPAQLGLRQLTRSQHIHARETGEPPEMRRRCAGVQAHDRQAQVPSDDFGDRAAREERWPSPT